MSEQERWAYEELQTGDVIEAGDQWQNSDGRWHALVLIPGASTQVRDSIRARRPHNITALQKERDESLAEVAKLSTALKSAQRARDELQLQVDELRANRTDEPTARQAQNMLRTWATELDWSGCCFDSAGRDKVSAVQRVLVSVIERIESMIDAEATSADA